MSHLSSAQKKTALFLLFAFHILVISVSNYLVQIPVTVFGFESTWGTFSFPLIFLATDLTIRIFGSQSAGRIVFAAMFPALLVSYIVSVIFFQGNYQSVEQLSHFNGFVARIALASFLAYLLGQLTDIMVFMRLRRLKSWWLAPGGSSILGTLLDTFFFYSVAFYASSDAFMAEHWITIAWVDYAFKLLVSLIVFLPIYGLLINFLLKNILPKTETVEPRTA
ncbi:MAG: 7-cyano-7-deazaguanine/7-aminomethyl-7-deazaguanine transporter [Gammaproteobacteria bacterium]|nr:7-cyano-7-deazaguanine/7-aminomethyl-7-deazaguanine transporter [Gammaproteobacteria bacterium]